MSDEAREPAERLVVERIKIYIIETRAMCQLISDRSPSWFEVIAGRKEPWSIKAVLAVCDDIAELLDGASKVA